MYKSFAPLVCSNTGTQIISNTVQVTQAHIPIALKLVDETRYASVI